MKSKRTSSFTVPFKKESDEYIHQHERSEDSFQSSRCEIFLATSCCVILICMVIVLRQRLVPRSSLLGKHAVISFHSSDFSNSMNTSSVDCCPSCAPMCEQGQKSLFNSRNSLPLLNSRVCDKV